MSQPVPLQDVFKGMFRDESRDQLPPGKLWNLEDFIPHELGASLRKRGGWQYHGVTLNSLNASAGQPDRVAYAPFSAGAQVIAIDSSIPRLFDLTNSADRGSVNKPAGPMVFYRDKLIIPSNEAGANPQKYTGSGAPAALGGSPPDFQYATVYKDRLAVVQSGTTPINTIKRIRIIDDGGIGGTFTLTFLGQTTATIAYNAVASTIQTALENLSNIAPGDVTVSDAGTAAPETIDVTIEFKGAYAGQNVAGSISIDVNGLTGNATTEMTTTQFGAGSGGSTRLFFSAAGNPESWDTTLRYIDTSSNVVALAPLPNALLVFHAGSVERIRGSIPPGSAAANMELDPLFSDVGLIDTDALAVADTYVYWADENGVYRTDGSNTLTDLTKQGGMSSYWREQIRDASVAVSLAVWRGYVWISLVGGSDSYVDFLVYDIEDRMWFRFKNIVAYNFATQFGATDELYFSNRNTASKSVGKLSDVFEPAFGNQTDADGDAVLPRLGTRFFRLGSSFLKRIRRLFVNYHLAWSTGTFPKLRTSLVFDPEEAGGTPTLSPDLGPNNYAQRERVTVNKTAQGVAFNIEQVFAGSDDTRIYGLELEAQSKEGSHRG